jgi:site-specific recombinase XerD
MTNIETLPNFNELAKAAPIQNDEAIRQTQLNSLSANTRLAYGKAINRMLAYFRTQNWETNPTQKSEYEEFCPRVLSYLQVLNDQGLSYTSINQTYSAVRNVFGYASDDAFILLGTMAFQNFLKGVHRSRADRPETKAKPLSLELLTTVHQTLGGRKQTTKDIRDRAVVAIGVAAALRSDSIAGLQLRDIRKASHIDGYVIHLRKSKTDQMGKGVDIPIMRAENPLIDPVRALEAQLDKLEALGFTESSSPQSALFPRMRGKGAVDFVELESGEKRLTPIKDANHAITKVVQTAIARTGKVEAAQIKEYSSHSLRATFVTLALAAGVSFDQVSAITGHSTLAVLKGYDHTSIERKAQVDYLK